MVEDESGNENKNDINDTVAAFNLAAFGEQEPDMAQNVDSNMKKNLKQSSSKKSEINPYMYKGKSKHPNWFNMNVVYDLRDAARAARIRQREKELAEERERRRIIEEKRAEFNLGIRENTGKLTLADLKKLNSVYKRDYIKMVVEEDDQVKEHLHVVDEKVQDNQTIL